ncbi:MULTISPECIES: hypothetical protein [Duffyella]|uniref:Uncharacterized protein n=1 Tax=Duffyella gerundensis TaxID=1619313 RepID=A0A0U5GNG3_9GAMM|nr:hypothetical protein [Duffyella gerundensis]QTO55550.1 hypothetical protein J8I88_06770 [Duffyella gerundensis]CUU24370.1 hypothetical protein EM595_2136 [Duffyella gerundensis]
MSTYRRYRRSEVLTASTPQPQRIAPGKVCIAGEYDRQSDSLASDYKER